MKDKQEKRRLLRIVRDCLDEIYTRNSTMAGIMTCSDPGAGDMQDLHQLQVELGQSALDMAFPLRELAAMGCMDDPSEEDES